MTEIPEHLLKRSKAAKAAASGDSPPADDATEAASGTAVEPAAKAAAPAAAPAAAVAEVVEPEPARVAAYVQAAQERKKMPFWIAPVLLALPFWAMMYVGTLERVPQGLTGLLGEGEHLYVEAGCSGCHGAEGGGGIGPAMSDGEVHLTFTSIEDQVVWIAKGSSLVGSGNPYSSADSARPRLVAGQMPGFGAESANPLDAEEILAVTLYERTQFEPGDIATDDLALAEVLNELLDTGEIDLHVEFEGADLTAEDVAGWLAPARAVLSAEG